MTASRYPRPGTVTSACYFLLCAAAFEFTRAILLGVFPRPGAGAPISSTLLIVDVAHAIALTVCTWFMFQGAKWARIAFYILAVLNIADLALVGLKLDLAIAVAKLVFAGALLVTPRANLFFSGEDPELARRHSKPKPLEALRPPRDRPGRYDY